MTYALHPSSVGGGSGRNWDYVGYDTLIHLYGLNPDECIDWNRRGPLDMWHDFTHLYPRPDGDYDLAKAVKADEQQKARAR